MTKTRVFPKVLILYTGGTIGMEDPGESSSRANRKALNVPTLSPGELSRRFKRRVPELEELAHCDIEILLNCDSAHIGPDEWLLMAERIREKWKSYDGVVVLHGTDTLAYSASALSFLLRPCLKPVVLTGAQRPLSALRTDARRNLMSAVEIAAYGPRRVVNQVCVFFDDRLFQGNRTRKRSAFEFAAFESPTAEPLAHVGTRIHYREASSRHLPRRSTPRLRPAFDRHVLMLHVTPGFPAAIIEENLLASLSALVLVVFASGTAPTHDQDFIRLLQAARKKGVPVIITSEGTSQTPGDPDPSSYAAGSRLLREGCIWAGEMTPECATVKAALTLGQPDGSRKFKHLFLTDWAGEGLA